MARSLEIIGERWTLLIVRDLLRGPLRFQDLAQSLAKVPPGLLSRRLKLLEDRGVVSRRIYLTHPPRAEYALTESGIELREVVRSLTIWGSKHLPGGNALVHNRCNHPIEMAYRCAHCDEVLALSEIEYRTAPRRRKAAAGKAPAPRKARAATPSRTRRKPRATASA